MGLISNGTTIFDNGIVNVGGSMTFISKATASASASIEFTLGDLKEYKFFFVNMHPATNAVSFTFNGSTDAGSNYNVIKTTTFFHSYQNEAGTDSGLGYQPFQDLAQSTSFQPISKSTGNGADESASGTLTLFNPSSTTYVKHFISNSSEYSGANENFNDFLAGYFNTTSAVNAIRFQMSSGNIDSGEILLFGVN